MAVLLLSSCNDAAVMADDLPLDLDAPLSLRAADINWCDSNTADPSVYLAIGTECVEPVENGPDLCCVHFRFKISATGAAWTLSTNPYDYGSGVGSPNPTQTVQYSGTVVNDCNGKMRVCFEQVGSHFIFQTFHPITNAPLSCNEYANQCDQDGKESDACIDC